MEHDGNSKFPPAAERTAPTNQPDFNAHFPFQIDRAGAEKTFVSSNELDNTEQPNFQNTKSEAVAILEQRLLQLIDTSVEKRILLSFVPSLFFNTFFEKINHKALGYKKFTKLLDTFPSILVQGPPGSEYIYRTSTLEQVEINAPIGTYVVAKATSNLNNDPRRLAIDPNVAIHAPKRLKILCQASELSYTKVPGEIHPANEQGALDTIDTDQEISARNSAVASIENRNRVHHQHSTMASVSGTIDTDPDNRVALNSNSIDSTPTLITETNEQLDKVKLLDPFNRSKQVNSIGDNDGDNAVVIDCKGVPDNIFLIFVATRKITYAFNCVKLGATTVCETLKDLLMDAGVTKMFHDLHAHAVALARIGGVKQLRGTLDTQLAMEFLTGKIQMSFTQMLDKLGQQQVQTGYFTKERIDEDYLFAESPLSADIVKKEADSVILLVNAKDKLFILLGDARNIVQRASDSRVLAAIDSGGAHQICFDVAKSHAISSIELLREQRPEDMAAPTPLKISDDAAVLIELLPKDLVGNLGELTSKLTDIILDKGRQPYAWVNKYRKMLGQGNRRVESSDIENVVNGIGGFETDNRRGLELHRISAIRNRQSDIIGLTMHVGRDISENATMISDLLFNHCSKSILFLGESGSGKTTLIREVTQLLAERSNVCIVDTNNEIAGDGDLPHACVGFARRMMVRHANEQADVMIECMQNHAPEVIVVDNIGFSNEVDAARMCRLRDVRLIAAAHGDFRKLVKDPKLRGLIGVVEGGDGEILNEAQGQSEFDNNGKRRNHTQKTEALRAITPMFDVIVELERNSHHEWRIVFDVASAVENVLQGQLFTAQRRIRDPLTGTIKVELKRV